MRFFVGVLLDLFFDGGCSGFRLGLRFGDGSASLRLRLAGQLGGLPHQPRNVGTRFVNFLFRLGLGRAVVAAARVAAEEWHAGCSATRCGSAGFSNGKPTSAGRELMPSARSDRANKGVTTRTRSCSRPWTESE